MSHQKMSTHKLTRIALLSAVLYVSKAVLEFLPNVELVSLLVLVYALVFGREVFLIILVFNLFELIQWGFGIWWVSYLYTWPVLGLIVLALRRFVKEDFVVWGVVAGLFGLAFGAMFAAAWLPVDRAYAISYWVSGMPWDVAHCISNFVFVVFLGKPLYRVLLQLKKV